ncbi:MAG: hypothetical protein ORN85_06430 [Sediminibacterium sp.]|nr:hypothetical protein [Sediminibacterium sp.]
MKSNLKKLEQLEEILSISNYIVRYEKGNFQSGWCLLEHQKIVILNKFLLIDDRIIILEDLIPQLDIIKVKLPPNLTELYQQLLQAKQLLFSS